MKLTFIANACQVVEADGKRILFDPWLTDGAFEGSWFHYPPLTTTIDSLLDVDALYISHLHPDHYSKVDLAKFRRDIPLFVLDHGTNFLHRILTADGFTNLIKIKHMQKLYFGPFALTMYAPFVGNAFYETELGNLIDSALVIEADGQKVLSTNDNTPSLEACRWLRERHGRFDVAQLQFNSAGPYPSCFANLTEMEKLIESNQLIHRNLEMMVTMAKALDAKTVQPFAGQYIIGGKLWQKNKDLGTTTPDQAAYHLAVNDIQPVSLSEGMTYDISDPKATTGRRQPIKGQAQLVYAESTKDSPYPWEADPMPDWQWLSDSCWQALSRVWKAQQRLDCFPDCDARLCVPPRAPIITWNFQGKGDPATSVVSRNMLLMYIDAKLLARILKREAHWNNAEIGCHIEFHRTGPYLPDVHTLMSFFHA